MILDFLLWITYQDNFKLRQRINYLHELLEVYALGHFFEVDQSLSLTETLLKSRNLIPSYNTYGLPDVWDRKYIDFSFVKKILNQSSCPYVPSNSLFASVQDDGRIWYAFDWLGEKSCHSPQEIENLKNSEDFKNLGLEIERNGWMPRAIASYSILAKRYPVATSAISVSQLLRGLSLIN